VHRCLHRYQADASNCERSKAHQCTKHKESSQHLVPGLTLGWCLDCGICIMLSVMVDAESPRTVFELFYTRCSKAPELICYDNGCNLEHYCRNREPEFFAGTDFYVDAFHASGHDTCSREYNTSYFPVVQNSSLAESQNAVMRSCESSSSYMNQKKFLWSIRYSLHRLNRIQRDKAHGEYLTKRRRVHHRKRRR